MGKKIEVEPPKESYKYPGICVSVLRLILSFVNTICFIAGLVFIGMGLYGQIMFRLKAAAKIDLETDPTFVTLIIGVIITLTTFNGTVGFFRGNTLMLKFFGWILVILFLLIFIGGIVLMAMYTRLVGTFEESFQKWIKLGFRDGNPSIRSSVEKIQSLFKCCGSSGKFDYTEGAKPKINSFGNCTYTQVEQCIQHPNTCSCHPPSTCCPGAMTSCKFEDAFDEGCIQKFLLIVENHTATVVGIWSIVWIFMIFQLISIRHTVRRITLSRKWWKIYGHIEAENKLKLKIAKKEAAMQQIEMDICVQDMG